MEDDPLSLARKLMAAGTYSLGLTVAPIREHAPLPLRVISSLLIIAAFTIAIGVPLLLSGVTGFNLWQGEGISMQPTFYEGDFVVTRDVPAGDLEPGDIVLFQEGEKHVMHRIVSIQPDAAGEVTLITRGDNNPANDPPVPESALIGKLVYDLSWLPMLPVDLSGTGLFVAEWITSVMLISVGLVLRRSPTRPSRATLRRSYVRAS
jgi:signal peptidase I